MSYLVLKEDCYLVDGHARSAIYDLASGRLLSISKKTSDLIKSMPLLESRHSTLSEENVAIVERLLLFNVVIYSDEPIGLKSIKSISKDYSLQFAWIEVTRQCNLTCTFCYEKSSPYCTERMSVADYKLVIDNLEEVGIKKIQFIGGEPLILRNDLKEMIMLGKEKFNFIEVYTNAVLINTDWCEFFKAHDIHIALSIHSYIAEEHDKLTQVKGSHKKVEKALSLIQKYNIPYRIGTVRSKSCKVGDKPKDYFYELNPKMPKVTGRAAFETFDFEMFKGKAITKQSKAFPINKKSVSTAVSGHQCFIKDIYISSLLEVYPCVMERRISYGNLKNSRLTNLINENIRKLSKDNIDGCKDCEYRYACFDCRPDANGRDFYAKPWFCSYNPKSGVWIDLQTVFEMHIKKSSMLPLVVYTNPGESHG